MTITSRKLIRCTLLATSTLAVATPALTAEVTPERLVNANKEPQNWLMNHRTYDGQRFSPLARINKDNVKGLKLAYAVPLGGGAGNEWNEATPLAEDGFLYIVDFLGRGLQDRCALRRRRPHRLAHGPEAGAAGHAIAASRCGAISSSPPPIIPPRIIATDKETRQDRLGDQRLAIRRRCASPRAARRQG